MAGDEAIPLILLVEIASLLLVARNDNLKTRTVQTSALLKLLAPC